MMHFQNGPLCTPNDARTQLKKTVQIIKKDTVQKTHKMLSRLCRAIVDACMMVAGVGFATVGDVRQGALAPNNCTICTIGPAKPAMCPLGLKRTVLGLARFMVAG
jgi:hypothetical protein